MSDVTRILDAIQHGDVKAGEELLPLVYDELRRLAAAKMARETPGQTLQPTALVHEAWLRLGADVQPNWQNRAHFLGAAAEAMRRILVERARRKLRLKRGGGQDCVELDAAIEAPADDEKILQVHEALEALAAVDPQKAQIVSWDSSVTGWTLQTNNNLTTGAWGNYTGAVFNNRVTNSAPTGSLFFRLKQP